VTAATDDSGAERDNPSAPWPVRRGGLALVLYENSLSLTFVALFLLSFGLHAKLGLGQYNEERLARAFPPRRASGGRGPRAA
jgi:hypothetical protein